ncbi:hypothetical protein LIER_00323 [Lithospermum erythrorhizon]|uniref:DUF868 family protein n=1 Tax=Lithospermum erythrorhizon TaxID=34254 RepID=A0AAV3NLM3_LITER
MMHEQIGIPACFSSGEKLTDDVAAVSRSGQSVLMSMYRTKMADGFRLITVTWCRNLLLHGLSVAVGGIDGGGDGQYTCKVELKPWYFWRKQGSKRFVVEGMVVDVFWDLKAAKFNGETEPSSEYYVAVICDEEVVLLLGDMKKDAYRKTGCRPALVDPVLVSRKEHIFGKKRFVSRVKFDGKGKFHEISIECKNKGGSIGSSQCNNSSENGTDPEMEIKIDGHLLIHVKHLQWKFRGNEAIHISKARIEVYWDVHDWLFSPGLRHGLFIFKPSFSPTSHTSLSTSSSSPTSSLSSASTPLSSQTGSSGSVEGLNANGASEFCLFLYAWKIE